MDSQRLFISYSRQDDEPFAKKIAERLEQMKFQVWWDRVSLPNRGHTFHREIREAIDKCERFILICGPGVHRGYVKSEWQYALENCKPIHPLLRKSNHSEIPQELKVYDSRDFRLDQQFEDEFSTLVRQVSETSPQFGLLKSVPSHDAHHQMRKNELDALSSLIFPDRNAPTLPKVERNVLV